MPKKAILQGVKILSLALNLPGPAAFWRCRQMGANCTKLEPPAPAGLPPGTPGDPMGWAGRATYDLLHEGIRVVSANAKTEAGQKIIHRELAKANVLLTSFRPSALAKLGLDWKTLHKKYPHLSQVAIVGAGGERAEEPGHDLTYMADNGLVQGLNLPPTLYADMGGSLMASEAILKAVLAQNRSTAGGKKPVKGDYFEVALADASQYLGLPLAWGMTRLPGTQGTSDLGGPVGGGHAGYKVYASQDGRVAIAALEPHFAKSLCDLAGVMYQSAATMYAAPTHTAVAAFLASKTGKQLNQLAVEHDLPLHTMGR
jgi:crotonobetainyl-CoA:carnitine CoA-transferase CaiB-like acyl-CoA transferase